MNVLEIDVLRDGATRNPLPNVVKVSRAIGQPIRLQLFDATVEIVVEEVWQKTAGLVVAVSKPYRLGRRSN
jgi:hypothetical protein